MSPHMQRDPRYSESETLAAYVDTVASSMETVLPILLARRGPSDAAVLLTQEAIDKLHALRACLSCSVPAKAAS